MIQNPADPAGIVNAFMRKAALNFMVAGLLLLTPFVINNLLQGRPVVGGLGTLVILLLGWSALDSARGGRYYPNIVLLGLLPAIALFLVFSMLRQGVIGLLWCFPAIMAFYVLLPERKAWLANALLLAVAIPSAWIIFDHAIAARAAATMVLVSVFSVLFVRAIARQQTALRRLATIDPLTGLHNRVLLPSVMAVALKGDPSTHPIALLSIDLDHFKRINDVHGHAVGDEVLREMGTQLREHFRRHDHLFRIGGEEFLVLLDGATVDQARQAAERFRQRIVSNTQLDAYGITVSAGVASRQPDDDAASWMARSDGNLYRAKQEGRNRVVG